MRDRPRSNPHIPASTWKIGVVEPQDEHAAFPPREQGIHQRQAGVADMDAARRRRRETNDGLAHGKPMAKGATVAMAMELEK